MFKSTRFVCIVLIASCCALPAVSQVQPCPQGSLASVLGTSCSIGPLVLNLQNFNAGSFATQSGVVSGGPINPADIGFIPIQTGNQAGFKLVTNFIDGPGADSTFASVHQLSLGYAVAAATNFEIRSEDLTMNATAQASPQGVPFVQVFDAQDYPNSGETVVETAILNTNGVAIPILSKHVNLEVPGLASDTTSLFTFNASMSTDAAGTEGDTLTSATFLYTMGPLLPAPRLAPLSYSNVDLPGMASTTVSNINDAGQMVGIYVDQLGVQHGYVTGKQGGFTTIDFPGASSTSGLGINNQGDVSGFYTDNAGNTHGYLLQRGTFTSFDFPNAITTFPIGINDKDQIVGEYVAADEGFHGFLFSNGQFTSIDQGPGTGLFAATEATGINDRGDIVGTFFAPNTFRAFSENNNVFQLFDVPGQGDSEPSATSNAGDIVGSFSDINLGTHGFLRSRGNFLTVDFPGSDSSFALGINTAGKIVGEYFDADGNLHSYLATPVEDNGQDIHPAISATRHSAAKPVCGSAEWRKRAQHGRAEFGCTPKQ